MQPLSSLHSKNYSLSVVIPTYNRADVLMECLKHLEDQTCKDFDVIVIDDGSKDSTPEMIKEYLSRTPLKLRYERQDNAGPARARNRAIAMVDSPITLMIGDDIFCSPSLVGEHLKLHTERPQDTVVALGLSRWSEKGQSVTPFMQWLDSSGLQFEYEPLLRGERPNWRHFYTSNISLKTRILRQFPFDESFPFAAMEDIELAVRIEARNGLEMVFLRDALAHHLHPTTFVQACRRMVMVGESAKRFDELWPGKRLVKRNILKRPLQALVLAFPKSAPTWVRVADWSLKVACPNSLMRYVLGCHFAMGYNRRSHASQ